MKSVYTSVCFGSMLSKRTKILNNVAPKAYHQLPLDLSTVAKRLMCDKITRLVWNSSGSFVFDAVEFEVGKMCPTPDDEDVMLEYDKEAKEAFEQAV